MRFLNKLYRFTRYGLPYIIIRKIRILRWNNFYSWYLKSELIQKQKNNPFLIPIIIINYNQLFYLKKLVNFLKDRGFENIIIIDNQSDYPPLLDYYNTIESKVKIERMDENYGHKVFFENIELQEKYGKGYFVITDADIVPNSKLPHDFLSKMIKILEENFKIITKVGFALDIKSIPDTFPLKEKVLKHESQFWVNQYEQNAFFARIDTTFAIYKPCYPKKFNHINRFKGIRIAGNFSALHGGWYVDPNNYTDENLHYIRTVKKASTWKLDEKGQHENMGRNNYLE